MKAYHTQSHTSGFSLIELLVSLSLFTIVITMAVGTLLVLIDANAKAQNIQSSMTNLNFALDSMTREIRNGYGYYCVNTIGDSDAFRGDRRDVRDCPLPSGGGALSIIEGGESLTDGAPADQHRIEYRLSNAALQRRVCTSVPCSAPWDPLTSDNITINALRFFVTNTEPLQPIGPNSDLLQPRVAIYISGTAGVLEGVDTDFFLQTTIVQRQLDI